MKTLIILRHGKAELYTIGLEDYDRALTSRGVRNASEMGKYILKKEGTPDFVLSSSANRAYQTAVLASQGLNFPVKEITADETLYLVSEYRLVKALSELPATVNYCLLVGHNPGLTDMVNYFGVRLDNLPTASAVCFTFQADNWENISSYKAEFQWIKLAREL